MTEKHRKDMNNLKRNSPATTSNDNSIVCIFCQVPGTVPKCFICILTHLINFINTITLILLVRQRRDKG